MPAPLRRALALSMTLGLASAPSCAQAQVIRFKNVGAGTGKEIPLEANSSVEIDAAGNLVAECALDAAGGCPGFGASGNAAGTPVATLSRTDNDASLQAGEAVRLA